MIQWCPYLVYTWTKKQVTEWVEANGSWSFYDGVIWKIRSKRIAGTKFYEVSFVRDGRGGGA